jgi:hypothetical protein
LGKHIQVGIVISFTIVGSGLGVPAAVEDLLVQAAFRRGDVNDDGRVDLSDPIHLLYSLFLGEKSPNCRDAADSNDDGEMDISDGIFLLSWLFVGSKAPPAPGPLDCGVDPTEDPLPPCASSMCPSIAVDFPGTLILGRPTDTSMTVSALARSDILFLPLQREEIGPSGTASVEPRSLPTGSGDRDRVEGRLAGVSQSRREADPLPSPSTDANVAPPADPRIGGGPGEPGGLGRPGEMGARPTPPDLLVFWALDLDGDGELSVREISDAVRSLKRLDKNGDGRIDRAELRLVPIGPDR